MTKSQMNIAAMLRKAGRKVTVIDAAKTLSTTQIADEQERERQTAKQKLQSEQERKMK